MSDVTDLSGVVSTIGIFVNQGTDAAPDWNYLCAVNARAFNLTRGEQTTSIVATCGPGASQETWREAGELDWTITGEAALELDTFDFCRGWILNGEQRSIAVVFYKGEKKSLTAHGYYQGLGVLLQYPTSMENANGIPTANISISKGAGTLTWTSGAPSFLTP